MKDFELSMVDGKRTYDYCSSLLDPKLVKFQFQVSTISQRLRRRRIFHEVSGPIHFHARARMVRGNQENRCRWDRTRLDWKKIFTAAKTGGIKNYFVEMDLDHDEGQRSLPSQPRRLMRTTFCVTSL